MDISKADIAALEKILMWAEDHAIGGQDKQAPPQEAALPEEPDEDLAPEELEEDLELPAPEEKEELARYSFHGNGPRATIPPPQEPKRHQSGRRGRY